MPKTTPINRSPATVSSGKKSLSSFNLSNNPCIGFFIPSNPAIDGALIDGALISAIFPLIGFLSVSPAFPLSESNLFISSNPCKLSFNSFAAFDAFLALSAFFLFASVLLFNPLTALSLPALTSCCACPCAFIFVAIPEATCIISFPFCMKPCPAVLVELNNLATAFIIVPIVRIIDPPIYIKVACATLPKFFITFDIPPNVADKIVTTVIIIPTVPKNPLDITNCNALFAPVNDTICVFNFVITPPK